MTNVMPDQYRQVAIAHVDIELEQEALRRFFLGREAYRRTRYIVVVAGERTALVRVEKSSEEPLFSPITAVEMVAGPDDCAILRDREIDTGIPSQLAEAARRHAPDKRCIVVIGRYQHLSFIVDPQPIEIVVRDVIPPHPAKLVDQARRIIAVSEDLPPIELIEDVLDLDELLDDDGEFLLPCAGAATDEGRVTLSYLDQRPPRRDWTLIGCARSQQIHTWFYGEQAPLRDFCPRRVTTSMGTVVLTKCCLLESGMEVSGTTVCVPWGSTLDGVRAGIEAAVALAGSTMHHPAGRSPGDVNEHSTVIQRG
ncbi:MAG TPA: hypothetical protein VI980_02775 [Acidimicrobiia bacterium]|nr:hypothetical protein [Acidimicrobiia bacterium]